MPPMMFMTCPTTLTGWKVTPPNMKKPSRVCRIDLPTPTWNKENGNMQLPRSNMKISSC